ncbi:MAG: chemotaxis protein CheA [Pseudomonadota bacterium]
MSDPMDTIRAGFFEECGELMEVLEAGLLALQDGTSDADTIASIFRAVHSVKGGAGAFDMASLVAFAHDFETLLDGVRSGTVAQSPALVATLLRAADRLSDLIELSRDGREPTDDFDELAAHLRDLETASPPVGDFTPVALDFGLDPDPEPEPAEQAAAASDAPQDMLTWQIAFRPHSELFSSGNEPLFLFRALAVLGRIAVSIDDSALPNLANLDPDLASLAWRITLIPSANDLTETEIEAIFEFAEDLCDITLECAMAPASVAPAWPDAQLPTTTAPPAAAPPPPASPAKPVPPAGSVTPPPAAKTIRVDLDRVDRLVNLVGELVISQSMLARSISLAGHDGQSDIMDGLDGLQQLTRDIQDSVMSIRAQPVKSLFQRMTRIVREAAQATGKEVRLEVVGEGTEIDKTVVERLADPLTHMIRNAIDHGLESPAERLAAGKPQTGIVRLSAAQQSDRVVIEVTDDGRGIDRGRVLARAVARGLVEPDTRLETHEIDRLLFRPGFSTNDEVSQLSGRGVGLDVVQKAIRDLNGVVSIASEDGIGCSMSASLPLTLAILDGMVVTAANQRMVIPLSAIVETQTLASAKIRNLGPGRNVAALQGVFVPMVDLAQGMGFPPTQNTRDDDRAILFLRPGEAAAYALQVDAIDSQGQVVIKGLADAFGRVPCVSAATILGDGQVALIVDPTSLAEAAGLARAPRPATHLEIVA